MIQFDLALLCTAKDPETVSQCVTASMVHHGGKIWKVDRLQYGM